MFIQRKKNIMASEEVMDEVNNVEDTLVEETGAEGEVIGENRILGIEQPVGLVSLVFAPLLMVAHCFRNSYTFRKSLLSFLSNHIMESEGLLSK